MNQKSTKDRAMILNLLVEGNSLRATTRLTGASINTVTKLLVEAGEAAAWYQDKTLRNLASKHIQVDEIWAFCGMKEKNVPAELKGTFGLGDVWTFTAIDAESKLIPSWLVGQRNACDATRFILDLQDRLANRVQLSTDGHKMYLVAVEQVFGADVDYAQVEKIYRSLRGMSADTRYSPGECCGIKKNRVEGKPNFRHISTSFVERANLTIRMQNRRFTRLTNAFSKKVENHAHMVALHFMAYNFVRIHKTLRTSPAMAAGVTDTLWSMEDVVEMLNEYQEEMSN